MPRADDPVVLRGRLAERGYSEIAVVAIVQLGDLVDPGSLPPGQQPLDLGVHLQAVALVEVRRPRAGTCSSGLVSFRSCRSASILVNTMASGLLICSVGLLPSLASRRSVTLPARWPAHRRCRPASAAGCPGRPAAARPRIWSGSSSSRTPSAAARYRTFCSMDCWESQVLARRVEERQQGPLRVPAAEHGRAWRSRPFRPAAAASVVKRKTSGARSHVPRRRGRAAAAATRGTAAARSRWRTGGG